MKHFTLCLVASLAAMTAAAETPKAETVDIVASEYEVCDGQLQHFNLFSPQLDRMMPVDVWLPSTYDPKREKGYPVIYMHDGQNLFDATRTWNRQAWEIDSVASGLISRGEIEAPIVVGIYNNPETRIGDLMPNGVIDLINPQLTAPGIAMMCPAGIRGDLYIDFIADTLKPVVDSLYNTRTDAASTSTMGSSMGGLISLNALCRRPDIFGGAGCLSTHITGLSDDDIFPTALNAFLIGNLPLDGDHLLYLDTGDGMIDDAYMPYFPQLCRIIEQIGYKPGENFIHEVFPGHAHREDNWMLRVDQPLKFLLNR